MPYQSNPAGKSTREMAKKRRGTALIIGLIGLVIILILGLLLQNTRVFGIGSGGILVLLVLLRIIPDIADSLVKRKLKDEKRAIRGAKAEETIGELLSKLSDEYLVLHDITSPYGNIDHIVFSKYAGIFLLETKSHGGRVEIINGILCANGKPPEKNFIAQTLKNTYWLKKTIEQITGKRVWISPVLVFTNAFVEPTRPVKGISIINKKYLLNILGKAAKQNLEMAGIWQVREKIAVALQ